MQVADTPSRLILTAEKIVIDNDKCIGSNDRQQILINEEEVEESGVMKNNFLIDWLRERDKGFFVGVDIVTRVCGGRPFNVTNLSYYFEVEKGEGDRRQEQLGVILREGTKYVLVAGSPLCLFQAELVEKEGDNQKLPVTATPTTTSAGIAGAGPSNGTETGGEENASGGPECFPGSAIVDLEQGGTKYMRDLKIGDRVRVGPSEFSEVFMFSHNDTIIETSFIEIRTPSNVTLVLTRGHYLYSDGELVKAKNFRVGNHIVVVSLRRSEPVAAIRYITGKGLFNPHTIQGDIVVNGVLASTFTDALRPGIAKLLLTPAALLHKYFNISLNINFEWVRLQHQRLTYAASLLR